MGSRPSTRLANLARGVDDDPIITFLPHPRSYFTRLRSSFSSCLRYTLTPAPRDIWSDAVSALQLVDKREVVRISLPSDRYVYQVASSSGKNYTIHLNPPRPTTNLIPDIPSPVPTATPLKEELDLLPAASMGESIPRTPSPPGSQIHTFNPLLSSPAQQPLTPSPASPCVEEEDLESTSKHMTSQKDMLRKERITRLANDLKSMYCPCAGWSYGCLAGEKTVLCKHLLAIIIASKTGREVRADVDLRGAAGLLGLS